MTRSGILKMRSSDLPPTRGRNHLCEGTEGQS